jgi:hypothetical protein
MEEAALRKLIRATLGLAFVATFTLANTANAAMILSFGLGTGGGNKIADATGTTSTTLTTSSPTLGTSVPVNITTIGNITLNPLQTIAARETFTGVTSTGAATVANGVISQAFSGTISYTDIANPATNYLTITFTNGVLRGNLGGNTASLSGDNTLPGSTVTFTSTDARVIPFLTDPIRNFEIGMTGVTTLALSGVSGAGTIADFTATNQSGNVSTATVIPEPTSVVMASTAVLVGLGCFKWRRSGTRNV